MKKTKSAVKSPAKKAKSATKHKSKLSSNDRKHLMPVIVKLLKTAKGKPKSVNNDYIRRYVRQQTGITLVPHEIRLIIHEIRVTGLVKCLVASQNGYWITKSSVELLDFLKSLQHRIKQIAAIHAAVKKQGASIIGRQKQVKSRKLNSKK